MKRALIASLLGISCAAGNALAAGNVIFLNYISSTTVPLPVWAGSGELHPVGQPLTGADGFNAELYYGLGSGLSFSQLTALPASITPVGTIAPGYIIGPAVILPDWTSGPVTFGILVFNGSSGIRSYPDVTWTEPASNIAPLGYPASLFTLSLLEAAYPTTPAYSPDPYIALIVPEPGAVAFAGLGVLTFLSFRRRFQAGHENSHTGNAS